MRKKADTREGKAVLDPDHIPGGTAAVTLEANDVRIPQGEDDADRAQEMAPGRVQEVGQNRVRGEVDQIQEKDITSSPQEAEVAHVPEAAGDLDILRENVVVLPTEGIDIANKNIGGIHMNTDTKKGIFSTWLRVVHSTRNCHQSTRMKIPIKQQVT